jgi:hypothetical protein
MLLPVIYSTHAPLALTRDLLPHYGRGDVAAVRIHPVGVNDTYHVQTTCGETPYLRVYRSGPRGQRFS